MRVQFELTIERDDVGWFVRLTSSAGHLLESSTRFDDYKQAAQQRDRLEAGYRALADFDPAAIDAVERFANGDNW